MNLKEIAIILMDNYHVTLRFSNRISVIALYNWQLIDICKEYNLKLEESFSSSSGNSIQGVFTLN